MKTLYFQLGCLCMQIVMLAMAYISFRRERATWKKLVAIKDAHLITLQTTINLKSETLAVLERAIRQSRPTSVLHHHQYRLREDA